MKKTLRKSEIKELNESIKQYEIEFSKKDKIEIIDDVIFFNNEPSFLYHEKNIIPHLKLLNKKNIIMKKITVDMGAIKFISGGADIMRPGILDIEDGIEKDEYKIIIDENNKKPIAVGIANFDSIELKKLNSGKVIRNVHYVGDIYWKIG